ncbi:MAG: hypothetical protein M1820_010609 [Bogoriella megaspora]|nr:MAG: hypothetical protein M1820_010609 [Bogoriella megaspora]
MFEKYTLWGSLALSLSVFSPITNAQCPTTGTIKRFYSFGSSWSDNGFRIASAACKKNTWPTCDNRFGNQVGGDVQIGLEGKDNNYLTWLANNESIITYDIAQRGATVDNTCISTSNQPYDLKAQVDDFNRYYSPTDTRCASDQKFSDWTAERTVFVMFMGDNDIFNGANANGAVSSTTSQQKLNCAVNSYTAAVKSLYAAGARKFLYISTPSQELSDRVVNKGTTFVNNYLSWKRAYDIAISSWWSQTQKDTTNYPGFQVDAYNFSVLMNDLWANPTNPKYQITKELDPAAASPYYLQKCTNTSATSHCIWYNDFHTFWQVHALLARDMLSGLGNLGFGK